MSNSASQNKAFRMGAKGLPSLIEEKAINSNSKNKIVTKTKSKNYFNKLSTLVKNSLTNKNFFVESMKNIFKEPKNQCISLLYLEPLEEDVTTNQNSIKTNEFEKKSLKLFLNKFSDSKNLMNKKEQEKEKDIEKEKENLNYFLTNNPDSHNSISKIRYSDNQNVQSKYDSNYLKFFEDKRKASNDNLRNINEIKKRLILTQKNLDAYFNNITKLKSTMSRLSSQNTLKLDHEYINKCKENRKRVYNKIHTVNVKNKVIIKKKIKYDHLSNLDEESDINNVSNSIQKGSNVMGSLIKITSNINEISEELHRDMKSILGTKTTNIIRNNLFHLKSRS